MWYVNVNYLRRLRRFQRLHSMGCQRCACTCNSCRNLVADCHRCRIARAECRAVAKAMATAPTHTISHQSAISSDRHRVQLESDCMCLAGTRLPDDRKRIEMVEKSWRRDARRELLCPVSSHSSNCSRILHPNAADRIPHPTDSKPDSNMRLAEEHWMEKLKLINKWIVITVNCVI